MAGLPSVIYLICFASAAISIIISTIAIIKHLCNYRQPVQQRLSVRIMLMIPLFAISCSLSIVWPEFSRTYLEPFKEIYEAFVIYTFFSLLTHILGGERKIIVEVALGKPPVAHPPPFNFLPPVDISDPHTFLTIKRGIMQYVWFKPFYCIASLVWPENWFLVLLYNIAVSVSLYDLALFWKCLYTDLKPHKPWGKFMCVKLIIFASYWQGMVISILKLNGMVSEDYLWQNVMLCMELIFFAIGHWMSFPSTPFSFQQMPSAARLQFWYAVRDCFGVGDLVYDFKATFSGGDYTYRNFDSVESVLAHPTSASRIARLNQGIRYTNGGRSRYWLNYGATDTDSIVESDIGDDWVLVPGTPKITDRHYPVVYDMQGHVYRDDIERMREQMESRRSMGV